MAFPLMLILSAVSASLSSQNQSNAVEAQKIEFEKQAEEEEISAEGQELQRRQQLNKILASNVVGQSTSGMSGEGTPESISLANAKQASISEGVESLSDRLKQAQLKRQGANIARQGKLAAGSTLLKGVSQVAELS